LTANQAHLGRTRGGRSPLISHQTVAKLLKHHGLAPAPERGKKTTWKDFIRSYMEVLASVEFFTVEVWAAGGLMTLRLAREKSSG
jgi:hypothetical protein